MINDFAFCIYSGDYTSAKSCIESEENYFQQQLMQSKLYEKVGNYQKSLDVLKDIKTNNYDEKLALSIRILYGNWRLEKFVLCKQLIKAKHIQQTVNSNSLLLGQLYNIIGLVFWSIGYRENSIDLLQTALEYHYKSLAERENIHNQYEISFSLNNIANTYLSFGNIQEALMYYNQALAIRKSLSMHAEEATTLRDLARLYMKENNHSMALKYIYESLEIRNRLNNPIDIAKCKLTLIEILIDLNRIEEALLQFYEAKELFHSLNIESKQLGVLWCDHLQNYAEGKH